jgi:hypothetical protein
VLRLDPVVLLWSELIVFLIVSSSKLIDLDSKPSTQRRFLTYEEEHEPHRFSLKESKNILLFLFVISDYLHTSTPYEYYL